MFVKCEKCLKIYDVPEEQCRVQKPHFFKCFACGAVFKVSSKIEDVFEAPPVNVMPLSEIFALSQDKDENASVSDENQDVKPANIDFVDQKEPVFEPVKPKNLFWSRLAFGIGSGVFAFLLVMMIAFFVRDYVSVLVTKAYDKGFSFKNTHFLINKKHDLFVSSSLFNNSEENKKTPFINILIEDKKGKQLQKKGFTLEKLMMRSKEILPFYVSVKNIHPDSHKIKIITEVRK